MNSSEQIKQEAKKVILAILPDVSSEDLNEESDIFSLGLDSINAICKMLLISSWKRMKLILRISKTWQLSLKWSRKRKV